MILKKHFGHHKIRFYSNRDNLMALLLSKAHLFFRVSGVLDEPFFDLMSSRRVVQHVISLTGYWVSCSQCQSLQNHIIRNIHEKHPGKKKIPLLLELSSLIML